MEAAASLMKAFDKSMGKTHPVLTKRRAREGALLIG